MSWLSRYRMLLLTLVLGLILALVLGLTVILLYRVVLRTQLPMERHYDFDILPASDLIIFHVPDVTSQRDNLFISQLSSGRTLRRVQVEGNITEICVLNDVFTILSVKIDPNRTDSDIVLYILNMSDGQLKRFTSHQAGVWENRLFRLSPQKFIFERSRVKTRWQIPFGIDTYGLSEGLFVGDTVRMEEAPIQLDTGLYRLEAVVAANKIVLSIGDRYFLARLSKAIDQPGSQIVYRSRLPFTGDNIVASKDGQLFYYTVRNTVFCWDNHLQRVKKIASVNDPIIRLRWSDKQLFFLTNSDNPTIWKVNSDGTGLEKMIAVDMGSK